MTYLVMECHPGYAVVLDQTGRFLKVANLNYQVGETVSFVIECTAEEEPVTIHSLRRRRILLSAASLAASFFLAVLGTWHICLTPYGAVRIQINPDLKLTVNRLDYVISADGLNDDGLRLLDGYRFRGQKLEQASDDLADRAMEMGYLKEGGQMNHLLDRQNRGSPSYRTGKPSERYGICHCLCCPGNTCIRRYSPSRNSTRRYSF